MAGPDQVAGASAAGQAAAGRLFHTNLSGLLGTCDSVGEVVGAGPDIPSVFSQFRKSPVHWSIITNRTWTAMGTGQAVGGDGLVYISVVFCSQNGGTVSPTPPPNPTVPKPAGPTPTPQAGSEVTGQTWVLDGPLFAIGARRAEIRTRLDRQAKSMLPDWYVGVCGTEDRERVLDGINSDSGDCPVAN
jgi:hypothetical protein